MKQGTGPSTSRNTEPPAEPKIPASTKSPLNIALHGISLLMNTGLSKEELDICLKLLEAGVNPRALIDIIQNLKADKNDPKPAVWH